MLRFPELGICIFNALAGRNLDGESIAHLSATLHLEEKSMIESGSSFLHVQVPVLNGGWD